VVASLTGVTSIRISPGMLARGGSARQAGGGLVEACPEQVSGRDPQHGAYLHTGPETLFEEFGLVRDRRIAKWRCPSHSARGRESQRVRLPGQAGPASEAAKAAADVKARSRRISPVPAREQEGAGLVAQALSYWQIAARLVRSEWTAEMHARSILAKPNFST
jgi:DNA-binding CsgD family transcriptional regulator